MQTKELPVTNHTEKTVSCPHCGQEYVIQHGGQKSGNSPAVHVIHKQLDNNGELIQPAQTVGYCSVFCLYENNGWDYREYTETMEKMGVTVPPPGFLSPSRKLRMTAPANTPAQ